MVAASEISAVVPAYAHREAGDEGQAARSAQDLAFAAHLEKAILAAGRLRETLNVAARQHAEVAAHLAAALTAAATIPRGSLLLHPAPSAPCRTRGGRAAVLVPDGDAWRASTGCSAADRADPASAVRRPAGLTAREEEVLRLLTAGRSNRRIAQALYLSPRTVQRHVANVYLKIGAHCRAEATGYALRHGLA